MAYMVAIMLGVSRKEMEGFDSAMPWIWISMSAPDEGKAKELVSSTLIGQLNLKFHDVDDRFRDTIERYPSSKLGKSLVFFNSEMSDKVVSFVKNIIDNEPSLDLIVCQCEAGISRSSGMAASLSKCINGVDNHFFNSDRYRPNMLVYRKVMDSWYKDKEGVI